MYMPRKPLKSNRKSIMDNPEQLFEILKLIKSKYDHIIHNSENEFNVFSILQDESDEVNLHSKFIYELLNPEAKHYKKELFTNLFLSQIGITLSMHEPIAVKREYKNIDLLITQKDTAIIIENKIWSGDQDEQIERYYNIIKYENYSKIFVIYLTPYGHEPSEQSIGTVDKSVISNISYQVDIDKWLSKCIKEVSLEPSLRETISQYKKIIQKITGKSHSREFIMEIQELILKDDNIKIVNNIIEAFTEVKIEIQYKFWIELKSSLENKGYTINDRDMCGKEDIQNYYQKRKRYYGIYFDIAHIDDDSNIFYCIEIDDSIYHGFKVLKNGEGGISDREEYDQIIKIISEINSKFRRTKWFLGWKYPDKKFNFLAFNDENIIDLTDQIICKQYTDEIAMEINDNITSFLKKFSV